ncbi:MAG: hypothetical protein U1E76_22595 [Planctomycetota bacterium]
MFATLLCLLLAAPAAREDADHHQEAVASDIEKLLSESRKALDEGDVPGAFKSLDAAKQIAPDDSRVAFLTGLSYLRQAEQAIDQNQGGGQADSALTDAEANLRQAAALSPASAEIEKALGHCLMLQGNEADAAKALESAQTLGAREPAFYLELGDAHFALYVKQKEAAEGDLGAAELALAEQCYQKGRAEVFVASLAKVTPENVAGNGDLAAAVRQRVIEAIAHAEVNGTYSALCRKVGFTRWYAKDSNAAFDAFVEGLQVAPAEAGAHQDLYSFVNQESSHLDATIALYNGLPSEDPLRFWFLAQLEVSRGNKGLNYGNPRDATLHYFAAMAAFETSVAVEPSYEADAKTWLALCHSYAGYADRGQVLRAGRAALPRGAPHQSRARRHGRPRQARREAVRGVRGEGDQAGAGARLLRAHHRGDARSRRLVEQPRAVRARHRVLRPELRGIRQGRGARARQRALLE